MVFTFPWYLAILLPLLFLGIGLVGVFSWRRGNRIRGAMAAAVGFGFLVTAGPSMLIDRVVVDDSGIHQSTGFWFNPTEKGFRYDEVESITLFNEIRRNTKGARLVGGVANELWRIHLKRGETRILDPGDLWAFHTEEMLPVLQGRGIAVIDQR